MNDQSQVCCCFWIGEHWLHSKLCMLALTLRMLRLLNGWQHMQHAGRRRGAQGIQGAQRLESTEPGNRSPRARLDTEGGTTGALQSSRRPWSIMSLP